MRLIDADKLQADNCFARNLNKAVSTYDYYYSEIDIEKAPTVEAIPREWIRDYLDYSFLSPAEYWAIIKMTNKWMEEYDNKKRPV